MGTATIVSSAGEGQYTINLDFGQDVLDARIANLNAQIARLDEELPTLEDSLATWEAEFTAAAAEQSSAISAYKLKLIGGEEGREERQAVEDATERLIIARITRDDIQQRVSRNQSSKISAQSRIDYYEGFNLTQTTSAWCADYTIDATGEVATIEVPGEPAAVLIVPGGDAPTAVDGNVVARIAQEAHQLYLNLAILPGWQKWAPTYRFGQITAIDREADTCEVELEAAESSEQNLDINQTSTLTDVPVEYMTCNSAAFEVFDDVVVKFESQSWDNPKVIGFKDHPRPCVPAQIAFALEAAGSDYEVGRVEHADWGSLQFYEDPVFGPSSLYRILTPPGSLDDAYMQYYWSEYVRPEDWVEIEGQSSYDLGDYSVIGAFSTGYYHQDVKIRFDRAITAERLNDDPSVWHTGFKAVTTTLDVQGQDAELLLPCIGPTDNDVRLLTPGVTASLQIGLPFEMENAPNEAGTLFTAIGRRDVTERYFPYGQITLSPANYSQAFSQKCLQFYTSPPGTIMVVFDGRPISYTLRMFGPPAKYNGPANPYFDSFAWKEWAMVTYIRTDLLDQI